MNIGGKEMSFLDHLEELRKVIIHSVMAVAVGIALGWPAAPKVLEYIIKHTVKKTFLLSPMEGFTEQIRVSIILGILFSLPFILWKVWSFIMPGLFHKERRLVGPLVVASLVLFVTGGAFGFYLVIPAMIATFGAFQTASMFQMIQLGELVKFVNNMIIACGILFQLPLVTLILTWMGFVTPQFLLSKWRHAIVIVLFLTAIITPGDVASAQIFMGLPIMALYFLSIGVAVLVRRKPKEKRDAA